MPKSHPGELNCKAKLTAEQIQTIRQSRESESMMAKEFGVSPATISDIRRFRSWKHLPREPRIDEIGEEWRAVPGYEGIYEVSSLGRIRNMTPQGTIRKVKIDRHGYVHVVLTRDKRRSTPLVHRLVMHAFYGACPAGKQVNHKNGDKSNNWIKNLEYVTAQENKAHAVLHGLAARGENSGRAKLTEVLVQQIRNYPANQQETARLFGIGQTQVSRIRRRQSWKHVP